MPFSTPPKSSAAASSAHRLQALAQRRSGWLTLAVLLLGSVAALTVMGGLPRLDRLVQQSALNFVRPDASDDIVIVAIDEKSLDAIGRWPWRRALHAETLRRINEGAPRCVGLDLLLGADAGAALSGDDALLAHRMSDTRCLVLPMAMHVSGRHGQTQTELLPAPAFARAATALGHVHLSLDNDGMVRGVYLREGFPGREWPSFSLALAQAGQKQPVAPQPIASSAAAASPPSPRWSRSDHAAIVFPAPHSSHRTVSYIDVLRGLVPPEVFRNRYVLVGATDMALSDAFASPAPMQFGLVPGVEIFAAELQGLLAGQQIRMAAMWQNLAFNLVPLAIVLLGLLWLEPLGVFMLLLTVLLLRTGVQVAQPWLGLRFSSAAGLGGLLLVYPLWSFMRLTAAHRFLRRGTRDLNAVLAGLPAPTDDDHPPGDFLDREFDASALAAQRMRDMHRFLRDGIDHLPDATLILTRRGKVFMANRAAAAHWDRPAEALAGDDAHQLLADVRTRHHNTRMLAPEALRHEPPQAIAGEGQDGAGRNVLLRCAPTFDAGNSHAGWMVSLVDITRMRRAQSQRDEALRFISHDIREPSASILTVLELARARPATLPRDLLLQRIERHARTGLELADGFVNLARAEAQPFNAELLDLNELLVQSIDNAWADARQREVHVVLADGPEEAPCVGDRGLLARALTNVLSNAMKYSPRHSEIRCAIADRGLDWEVSVRDQGPGIPAEQQSQLFQPFHRLHSGSHPEVHGVGLGLLLVRTVVQRHHGSVRIDSAADAGCAVILTLPKLTTTATMTPIKTSEREAT